LREPKPEVAAILARALRDEFVKGVARENAGVLGEQAEQQAHQQHFEREAVD
jgi:hypothetical protein